jgi:hypothetical protein
MYSDKRISSDYIKGLSGFLQVAKSNKPSSGFITCPCKKCKNEKDYSSIKSLHDHLFNWGFMPNYFVWTKHGERGVIMEDDEEENDTIPNWSQGGAFVDKPMGEDYEEMGENQGPNDALGEELREAKENCGEKVKESKKFERMLEDHKKPLHPDCKEGHKKLGGTLKASNEISDMLMSEIPRGTN